MKDVGAITRISPQARAETIAKFIKRVKSSPEAHKLLTDWGMDIEDNAFPLEARVLPPETLIFGRGRKEVIGPKGDWNRAATSSVLTPVNLTKWAILFVEKNKNVVQAFCKAMQINAKRMDITIANPKVLLVHFCYKVLPDNPNVR